MRERKGLIRHAGLLSVFLASMIMGAQLGGCPGFPLLPRPPCSQESRTFLGGELVTLDASGSSGAGTSLTYEWVQLTGTPVVLSAPQAAITTFTAPNVTGTLTFELTVTDVFGATDICVASATIQCVPTSITEQPVDQTLCEGETATFAIAAEAIDAVTYRWQHRSVEGVNWVDLVTGDTVSGADTPTLTLVAVSEAGAGSYRCVVTGTCGVVTSNEATLTVKPATIIVSQPNDRVVVIDGELPVTVTFSVTASGSGTLTYQWRRGGVNIVNGGGYSGATTRTLTITDVSANHEGSYRCVVTGECGSVTSAAATLTVDVPG